MKKKRLCRMVIATFAIVTAFNFPMICETAFADSTATNYSENDGTQSEVVNGKYVNNSVAHAIEAEEKDHFKSFTPTNKIYVNKFRKIGIYRLQNRTGRSQKQTAEVTSSKSEGCEWNGNISFTAGVRAGILREVKTQLGFGIKVSRSKNEAVGYSAKMTVSPNSVGTIKMYYSGWKSYGKLKTYTFNTANPSNKIFKTTNVNTTLFPTSYLAIYTTMSEVAMKK